MLKSGCTYIRNISNICIFSVRQMEEPLFDSIYGLYCKHMLRNVLIQILSSGSGTWTSCNFGQHHARMEDGGSLLVCVGFFFLYRNLYKPRNSSNRRDSTSSNHTKGAGSSSLCFVPKMKNFTIIKLLQQLWIFWSPHWNLLVIFNFQGWEFSLTGISLTFFHHGPWMRHTK